MKKLTHERTLIACQAIIEARNGLKKAEALKAELPGTSYLNPEWREAMQGYWKGHETIMDTLGCSMTRADQIIDGTHTLETFYEPNGDVKKK
jgi:hypothetical protein